MCTGKVVGIDGINCAKRQHFIGPKEQFNPVLNNPACSVDTKKASMVCPDNTLPELSAIVANNITGIPGASSGQGKQSSFRIQCVKNRFYQNRSTPPIFQTPGLFPVCVYQGHKINGTLTGTVHIRGYGSGLVGRSHRSRHQQGFAFTSQRAASRFIW